MPNVKPHTVTLVSAPLGFDRYRVDDHFFLTGVPVEGVSQRVVDALADVPGYEFDVADTPKSKTPSPGSSGGNDNGGDA